MTDDELNALAECMESVLSDFNQDDTREAVRATEGLDTTPVTFSAPIVATVDGFLDLYALESSGHQPSAAQSWLDADHGQMVAAYQAKNPGMVWDHDSEACEVWESDWKFDGPAVWLEIHALADGTFQAQMSDTSDVWNCAWLNAPCATLADVRAAFAGA